MLVYPHPKTKPEVGVGLNKVRSFFSDSLMEHPNRFTMELEIIDFSFISKHVDLWQAATVKTSALEQKVVTVFVLQLRHAPKISGHNVPMLAS